jgi:flagellar hook-associated protein 1 FlgK
MGLETSLLIATSGLANVNRQLAVVSQNVANANTPGYVRSVAGQSSLAVTGQGMGVRTGVVSRDIDLSLQADLFSQNAGVADAGTTSAALARIIAVQGTPGDGTDLASRLGAVRDAFSSLQTDPGNALQQTRVVAAASTLATAINTMSAATGSARQTAQDDLVSGVDTLNTTLRDIGRLSDRVMAAQAAGISTAEWENQRDVALTRMSGLVDVRVLRQSNGDMMLLTGASTILPTRGSITGSDAAFSIAPTTLAPSTYYPSHGVPAILLNGADVSAGLTGGSIGADLALRDTILPTYQAQLDEFSQTLSTRVDAQGLALFTDSTGAVPMATGLPAQAGYVGYSNLIQVNPAITTDPALVRDGKHDVAGDTSGASAFTANPAGGPVGFTDMVARVIAYSFGVQVQPGVAQPQGQSQGLGPSGTLRGVQSAATDLAGIAAAIVGAQASDAGRAASNVADATSAQVTMQGKVATRSAVKIDNEMSMMVQLQSSYAATAKLISAVQSMWTQTLAMVQ